MDENKMHLINKIFNNETIRTVWNKEEEKYYISIVDIVGVLAESKNPTVYWRVLKKRLKEEGNETVTNCNGLKMQAADGIYPAGYNIVNNIYKYTRCGIFYRSLYL